MMAGLSGGRLLRYLPPLNASERPCVPASKFDPNFTDRLKSGAEAKQAALEKFRAKAKAGETADAAEIAARAQAQEAKLAKRAAAELARRSRHEEVKAAKLAEIEAAKQAEADRVAAELAAAEASRREAQKRAAALEVEQKAARDARYAARKARK